MAAITTVTKDGNLDGSLMAAVGRSGRTTGHNVIALNYRNDREQSRSWNRNWNATKYVRRAIPRPSQQPENDSTVPKRADIHILLLHSRPGYSAMADLWGGSSFDCRMSRVSGLLATATLDK
jgi:hypothetical protein